MNDVEFANDVNHFPVNIERERERENVDLSEINVIEMPVPPTFGIVSSGHNINGVGLL